MKSIALALIWVALYFGPDVYVAIHGKCFSDESKGFHALLFLTVSIFLLLSLLV